MGKNKDIEDVMEDKFTDSDKFDIMDARREDEYYHPPSALDFSQELIEAFEKTGYKLKWVRMRDGQAYDTKSLRKRLSPAEGYTFVTPDEVDPDVLISLGDTEQYGSTAVITNGDLVLMKVRREKAEARRRYYEGKTAEQSHAIEQRMRQNQLDGGSKTVTRTGKNAHFMG
jgi:hypothetical protein